MRHFFSLLTLMAAFLCPRGHADTIATYPPGTILENLAIAEDGSLFVTDLGSGTIFRATSDGSSSIFGTVPGPAAGIAVNVDGAVIVAAGTSIYRFTADGTRSLVSDVAGAMFLNGLTLLSPNVLLAADDTAATIWKVDLSTGSTQAWLTGPLLVPDPAGLPIGPNGVKLRNGDLYISVTGSGTILRVPILPDGSAGTPGVYASSLQADDFAFGADGSLFAATQIGEIIRLYPDGTRTSLPTGTLGDAAVAFGRTTADANYLYVVNNGGAFLGLPDGPGDASIVRLITDTTAASPTPEPASLLVCAAGLVALGWLRRRDVMGR